MQWFSTRVPRNPKVPPVQSQGSVKSQTNFHFILSIKLTAVFCVRRLNYCAGVPRAIGMFPWGSAPSERLKITGTVVRTSASQSVDLGFIPQVESHQKT